MSVIGLGAWCDYVAEARDRNGSPEGTLGPRHVDDAVDSYQPGLSFEVHEFADLSDGRRLTLHTGRGFTSQPSETSIDPWQLLTIEHLEANVRMTVLPDDDTGEEHPWTWLAELLRSAGVVASPEQLKHVPYDIEFSPRLRTRLQQ